MLKIAINGFGRIGRAAFRLGWGKSGVEFAAINDLTAPKILAHLLKYDSVFRAWDHEVEADETHLIIDGKKIPVLAEKEPAALPWGKMKIDVVLECSGRFTLKEQAGTHLKAGAKAVIISAPSKDAPTYIIGVNHKTLESKVKGQRSEVIINNGSCTTNSVAPVMAVLQQAFGVRKAMLTTIHSVTAGQNIVDSLPPALHPDLRRARSALVNMVPTSTGAAKVTAEAMPELKGLFDGVAVRVPCLDVSLTDVTVLLSKNTTVEEVNKAFKDAAHSKQWKGILAVSDTPLVSSDFIGNTYSTIVDLLMTRVVDGDLVKVMAWYDNEWGYAGRLVEMAEVVAKSQLKGKSEK